MSNQQVDEALNDYFSDLLGSSDSDTNNADEISETPPADTSEDKASLDKPAQADNCENVGVVGEANKSKSKQPFKEASTDEPPPTSKEHTDSVSTAGIDINKRQVGTLGTSYSELGTSQHSPKKQASSQQQSLAESSGYSEHKKKLEKMLQQVTALNTSNNTDVVSTHTDSTETSTSTHVDTDLQVKTASSEPSVAVEPEAKIITKPVNVTASDISTENITESLAESHEETASEPFLAQILTSQWNENGRPEWAQDPFDILLVDVNGLQLAVPLVALGQIQEIEEEITPLFGQSSWFMGLQKTPTGNVKVVNTAQFIMPERYKDEHNYKFVISINGLQWGLAVDAIKQPISIKPEEIRWRTKRESRPWMAGMVKDHMCVLLDIPKVGSILQDQDKNRAD